MIKKKLALFLLSLPPSSQFPSHWELSRRRELTIPRNLRLHRWLTKLSSYAFAQDHLFLLCPAPKLEVSCSALP